MGRILFVGAACSATAMLLCGPAFASRDTSATATWHDLDRYVAVANFDLEPVLADLRKVNDMLAIPVRGLPRYGRDESPYFYAELVWAGEKPHFHMLK